MNNISFQGHSSLIFNPQAYDTAITTTSKAYRHLSSQNNCKLTNGKVFTSKADAQNLAVIVRNEKDGIIKIVPINGKIQQIIDEIALKVEELKKLAKGKLTAWIIGGENIKSANGENTINTVNKIAGIICDRPDIDASILAGSKSGEEKIVLHTLSGQLEIILDKSLNKQHNLEDYFDIVELNNTDLSFTK